MNGPFEGPLSLVGGVCREALPAPFAAALAAAQTHPWTRPADAPADPARTARAVYFTVDPTAGVTYEADLTALRSWSGASLAQPAALAALARAGRCLAHLHARGLVHGDVRAEMLYVGDGGAVAS